MSSNCVQKNGIFSVARVVDLFVWFLAGDAQLVWCADKEEGGNMCPVGMFFVGKFISWMRNWKINMSCEKIFSHLADGPPKMKATNFNKKFKLELLS